MHIKIKEVLLKHLNLPQSHLHCGVLNVCQSHIVRHSRRSCQQSTCSRCQHTDCSIPQSAMCCCSACTDEALL